jgi:hypothetical protein
VAQSVAVSSSGAGQLAASVSCCWEVSLEMVLLKAFLQGTNFCTLGARPLTLGNRAVSLKVYLGWEE